MLSFLSAGRFLFLPPPRPLCCRLFDAVRCAFRDHCSVLDIRYVYKDVLPQTKTVYYIADFKKQISAEKLYCLHRNPPWNAIIGQLNPTHTLATLPVLYILLICFHLFLGFSGSPLCSHHSYHVHLESRVKKVKQSHYRPGQVLRFRRG